MLKGKKIALQADTGKYVARCRGCSPTSAYPDTVTIHVDDPKNAPYAQWTIVDLTIPESEKEGMTPTPQPTTTPTKPQNNTVPKTNTSETKVTEKSKKVGLAEFLSLAPILLMILLTFTAGILIEFNRFYPDLLFHPLG